MKVGDILKVPKNPTEVHSGDYIYTLNDQTIFSAGDNRPLRKDGSIFLILPYSVWSKINYDLLIETDLISVGGTKIYTIP